jgi:AraC-like DNA-binding protein
MLGWQAGANIAAVAVAFWCLLRVLVRRRKSDAEVLFALVCCSMSLSLMRPWAHAAPEWMQWAMAIGGSATCNGYWLVSRALFRGDGAVGRVHLSIAAGMAILIAAYRGIALQSPAAETVWTLGLGSLLTFGSSALLAVTFLEGLRGWSLPLGQAERRMRIVFLCLFAACILSSTLVVALAKAWPAALAARTGVIGLAALAMLLFTNGALQFRRSSPLPRASELSTAKRQVASASPELASLAQALLQQLETSHAYREPELKVSELAMRLSSSEYKLSRVITQVLGERNFNQLINRYRIAEARRLLADGQSKRSIVEISGESGFASLGPFNRAFKAATGLTPSAFRARCLADAQFAATVSGDSTVAWPAAAAWPAAVNPDSPH